MSDSAKAAIKNIAKQIKEIYQETESPFIRKHSKSRIPTSNKINNKMEEAEVKSAIDNIPKAEETEQPINKTKIVAITADAVEKEKKKLKSQKRAKKEDPTYKPDEEEPIKKPRKPYTRKNKIEPKADSTVPVPQYSQGSQQSHQNYPQPLEQLPQLNNTQDFQQHEVNINLQLPNPSTSLFENPYTTQKEAIQNSPTTPIQIQQQSQYPNNYNQLNFDDIFHFNTPLQPPHTGFIARKTQNYEPNDEIHLSCSSITNSQSSQSSAPPINKPPQITELTISTIEQQAITQITEMYKDHYEAREFEETKPKIMAIMKEVQDFLNAKK